MLIGEVEFPTNRWVLTLLGCICLGLLFRASAQNHTSGADTAETHTTWRNYGGSADGSQYSALRQIDRSNVKELKVAWTYRAGDDRKYVFNPIVVDRTMYILAKNNSIVALDAATGKEIWTHPTDPNTTLITNRGIDYWESAECPYRPTHSPVRHRWQSGPPCRPWT
jgi:quinoprotein glucose dehydrogenase